MKLLNKNILTINLLFAENIIRFSCESNTRSLTSGIVNERLSGEALRKSRYFFR